MTTEYRKPLPWPLNTAVSREFWEGAKRRELMLPRCRHCGRLFWYPREQCPNAHCFADARLGKDIEWAPVSPRGRLYSYTIIYEPPHAGFAGDVPYVNCIVELDAGQGIRMMSNLVDCPLEDVKIDMPVEAVFEEVTPDWTLVKFRPA